MIDGWADGDFTDAPTLNEKAVSNVFTQVAKEEYNFETKISEVVYAYIRV